MEVARKHAEKGRSYVADPAPGKDIGKDGEQPAPTLLLPAAITRAGSGAEDAANDQTPLGGATLVPTDSALQAKNDATPGILKETARVITEVEDPLYPPGFGPFPQMVGAGTTVTSIQGTGTVEDHGTPICDDDLAVAELTDANRVSKGNGK